MRRRFFFGSILAGALLVACPQVNAADSLSFELDKHNPRVMVVRGNGDAVADLAVRYQDALWPEWRSDAKTVLRNAPIEKHIRTTGVARVYVGCDITRKAFAAAIR
jgi:hypothetical protein